MEFLINEEKIKDIVILKLYGNLDAFSASQLEIKIDQLIDTGIIKFVIDMECLKLISSAGWSIFIECAMQCKKAGGDIKLAGMNEAAERIYKIMRLNTLINSFETAELAIKSFK